MAIALFVLMLAPTWGIASFVVDGITDANTAVATRALESPSVHHR